MKRKVESKGKENYVEYTNSADITVRLMGMPPLIPQSVMSSVKRPKKPQYSVSTASGDIEFFDHDETTLRTDEEKAAWSKYLSDEQEAESLVTERLLRAILMEAVFIINKKEVEVWRKKQKLIGMDIPEDPDEYLQLYKETQVIRSNEEMQEIMDIVLELTGVKQEDVESMKGSFPDSVEPKS